MNSITAWIMNSRTNNACVVCDGSLLNSIVTDVTNSSSTTACGVCDTEASSSSSSIVEDVGKGIGAVKVDEAELGDFRRPSSSSTIAEEASKGFVAVKVVQYESLEQQHRVQQQQWQHQLGAEDVTILPASGRLISEKGV